MGFLFRNAEIPTRCEECRLAVYDKDGKVAGCLHSLEMIPKDKNYDKPDWCEMEEFIILDDDLIKIGNDIYKKVNTSYNIKFK